MTALKIRVAGTLKSAKAGTIGATTGPTWLSAQSPGATVRRLEHTFWSTPLAANAPLASTSAGYVSRLAYQGTMNTTSSPVAAYYGQPYNTALSTGDYSLCIYVMPANWPRQKVWATDTTKTGWQTRLDLGVPVPNPTDLPDGTIAPMGTDGSIIIIQGNELWELWQFRPGGPTGYAWQCAQGGYMTNYRTHPGWWSGSSYFGGGANGRTLGYDWGVAAAGQSYLGGILTAEDFYADTINHLLPISLPITGGGASTPTHILPATRFDQNNLTQASNAVADDYRLPHGARFRLPTSFDIETWVTQKALATSSVNGSNATTLRKILICLRDYGMMVVDTAGIVGFSGEHEKVYGTPYHPYSAAQRPNWGNFGQQMPWTSLVQVQAPTTDISVPAEGPA